MNAEAARLADSYMLASVLGQTYPMTEIIVVDTTDGESELPSVNIRRIAGKGLDVTAARNVAAREARGDFLLFLDERNVILMPDCIEVLVSAAQSSGACCADGLSIALRAGRHAHGWTGRRVLHLSDWAVPRDRRGRQLLWRLSLALISRDAFETVGGFPVGDSDIVGFWQLLASVAAADLPEEVVPRPAFWHRPGQTPPLGKSTVLESFRSVIKILGRKPVGAIEHLVENLVDANTAAAARGVSSSPTAHQKQRETAMPTAPLEPDLKEALEAFFNTGWRRVDRGHAGICVPQRNGRQ